MSNMVLDKTLRPDVLPTDRLGPTGVCRPELRGDIRKIADVRNALSVTSLWVVAAGVIAFAVSVGTWYSYLIAFVIMGPLYVRFAILMHEAAHKLLFSNKKVNDFVGTYLIAYPAFTPIQLYRRAHFSHHREEFGPDEPDIAFYGGYQCDRRTLRRRLVRDAVGISGWKNFASLVKAVRNPQSRPVVSGILATQAVMWAGLGAVTGRWWIYPALWWLPWMTEWRVLNRLRSIAEHGGLEASKDRRVTTHAVRQSVLARIWLVPYNTGWHLAHHVDMGVPWRNLPRYHAELERAGYITPGLVYPSYFALWRALSGAESEAAPVAPAA